MKILSIGNSFSQDATSRLYQIAYDGGERIKTINLYIGGCSLETHLQNWNEGGRRYLLECNGESTVNVSLKEALESDNWDAVTFQQVSQLSMDYITYQPYLSELAAHVREVRPDARPIMHQTWAYEQGGQRMKEIGLSDQKIMFERLQTAYRQASEDLNAGLIPCGAAFQYALKLGINNLHRDSFHASETGRYLLGLVWYGYFFGKDRIKSHPYGRNGEESGILKQAALLALEHGVVLLGL